MCGMRTSKDGVTYLIVSPLADSGTVLHDSLALLFGVKGSNIWRRDIVLPKKTEPIGNIPTLSPRTLQRKFFEGKKFRETYTWSCCCKCREKHCISSPVGFNVKAY